jgi:serine/threonine protein kinase
MFALKNGQLLNCNLSAKLGQGNYGKVHPCDSNMVVKQSSHNGKPFSREHMFIDRTENVRGSWVQMHKIVQVDPMNIAMERVESDLSKQMDVSLTKKLIRCVKEFHTKTMHTHNDIKPENVGITQEGELLLLDLGSTIHSSELDVEVPQTMMYTPMSDMDTSVHENRVRRDEWALACTIYELVVVTNDPSLRCSSDRHLFYREGLKNPLSALGISRKMTPRDLQYILGLRNFSDESMRETSFLDFDMMLAPKRQHFNKHKLGKQIFKLMCPSFDIEKFDEDVPSCVAETTNAMENSSNTSLPPSTITCSANTDPVYKRVKSSGVIDRQMVSDMKRFVGSVPKGFKWGADDGELFSGGSSSLQSKKVTDLQLNSATLAKLKVIIDRKK